MKTRSRKNRTVPASAAGMRLNRYIARSGTASRRKCDDGIQNGMVTVNGALVTDPSIKIKEGDTVLWDGAAVVPPEVFIAVMNKPSGYETTMNEKTTRPVTLLTGGMPAGATPVGRLDVRTGGVLLWSNQGELIYRLTHPKWRIEREYCIISALPVTNDTVKKLIKGAYIEPRVFSKPISAHKTGSKTVNIVLKTGRNREVRKLAKACGIAMSGLERVRYGSVLLGDLPRGEWRELTFEESEKLFKLVKLDI